VILKSHSFERMEIAASARAGHVGTAIPADAIAAGALMLIVGKRLENVNF